MSAGQTLSDSHADISVNKDLQTYQVTRVAGETWIGHNMQERKHLCQQKLRAQGKTGENGKGSKKRRK